MSFDPNITPGMVASLVISPLCSNAYPCKHKCKIVLLDGRVKHVTLGGLSVNSLFNFVHESKITCKLPKDHFEYLQYEIEPADRLLKRLFNQIYTEADSKSGIIAKPPCRI